MRIKLPALILAFMLVLLATPAHADPLRIGLGADVGVPAGANVGIVVVPKIDWIRVQASLAYNAVSLGGRLSLQLDPMALIMTSPSEVNGIYVQRANRSRLPIGLFADLQGGFFPVGHVPGTVSGDLPQVGYDYFNAYLGLRLGDPNYFHWTIEAGPSFVHVITGSFQTLVNTTGTPGLIIGNPTVDIWVTPTFMTGFEVPIRTPW